MEDQMKNESAATGEDAYSRREFLQRSGAVVAGATGARQSLASNLNKRSKKVRIGVVGGGFGAAFPWHEHPDCIVEAVSDLRRDRREKLMRVYQCGKSYESLEKLILDRDVEAVSVFTGAPDHVRHCVACLRAGKHVICAVPAAISMEQAQELLATVKETGLTYMMAETSYYYQSVITARKWFEERRFGEIFYTEAEYHHPGPLNPPKGSLQVGEKGNKTWRYGYPPMLYPTHSVSLLVGITGERLTEVTCLGWKTGMSVLKDNAYDNPFRNSTAFFKTNDGHGFRVSEFRYGALPITVRAEWYGTQRSFLMERPNADGPLLIESRDSTGRDDAGFQYQESALVKYEQPQWWKTDLLPEPLRHGSGHDGSHPFLTHEFIDALMHERRPAIDIHEALAYTVPGIVAHESALQGGVQLKIPSL